MGTALQFGFGIRRLMDAHQRWVRAGLPVYLRLRNFNLASNPLWSQLGFSVSPSGTNTGTQDILIDPPPYIGVVSQHNIGMSEGKLRFGARTFHISHSFVIALMQQLGMTDATLVWRDPSIVGLVVVTTPGALVTAPGNLLCDIVQYLPEYGGADIVSWGLTCNCNEVR